MLQSDTLLGRLSTLHPKLIDLSLDRMWRLLERLGNPQDRLPPVIHVAGTNGKGSVIAYLRAFYEAAGRKAHVFTSPHLVHFHERIRLAGALISENALSTVLAECESVNDGEPITFFEITTAAALLAFSRHDADVVLLEVGLGGRFDSTNVIKAPAASIITPVAMDHTDFLGPDIASIAQEKAGIIKAGCPVIAARQEPDAAHVIERQAARLKAPLFMANEDWHAYGEHGRLVYQDDDGLLDLPAPALPGRHQFGNAGTAIAALRAVSPDMPVTAFEKGMKSVTWPARLQKLSHPILTDPAPDEAEIWLDGGHNPAAALVVAEAMAAAEERDPRPLYLIMGMLNTKDPAGFLHAFEGLAKHVTAIPIANHAHLAPQALADLARAANIAATIADDVFAALATLPRTPRPRILICGSLYLAGAVLGAIEVADKEKSRPGTGPSGF